MMLRRRRGITEGGGKRHPRVTCRGDAKGIRRRGFGRANRLQRPRQIDKAMAIDLAWRPAVGMRGFRPLFSALFYGLCRPAGCFVDVFGGTEQRLDRLTGGQLRVLRFQDRQRAGHNRRRHRGAGIGALAVIGS